MTAPASDERALAWIDGGVRPLREARVGVEDRGVLFGEAVYEAFLTRNRRPFALEAHLERLERSLRGIGLGDAVVHAVVRPALDELFARAGAEEGLCYLQVSGGAAPRDHLPPDPAPEPRLFVTWRPFDRASLAAAQARGYRAVTHPDIRWPFATYKTTQLLSVVMAKRRARSAGADEVIFVDRDDHLLEGGSTNLFVVIGGRALTCPLSRNVLPGVTRRILLELRPETCAVAELPRSLIAGADEVFVSSSTRFCLGVVSVDGRPVGDGRPGPVTRELADQLHRCFLQETEG